jgi:hypothetical protein
MRTVLRLLGTRYGLALIAAVLVLAVVGVVRGFAGSYRDTDIAPAINPSRTEVVADPTAGDDSVVTPAPVPEPSTSRGAPAPDVVAADFLHAWLHHDGVTPTQWQAGFARYATPALRDKFKETDPAGVPAQRTTGPVVIQNRAATFVEASVPVDSGTVRLRLVATNGRWFVDGVDWERA